MTWPSSALSRPRRLAAGITAGTYNQAMAGIAPVSALQTVIDNQPEFATPIWSYLDSAVSARRVADGQVDADALRRCSVAASKPVRRAEGNPGGDLGMETDYGSSAGDYNLFSALATRPEDPRQRLCARRVAGGAQAAAAGKLPSAEMTVVLGRRLWPDRSSCLPHFSNMPSMAMATARSISGLRRRTHWPRPRRNWPLKAGRADMDGLRGPATGEFSV